MPFDPSTVVGQYGEPADEVRACRTDCALFDFSFVARARLQGSGALAAIAHVTGRRLPDFTPGRIRYAMRENRNGHLVSDLTIWCHESHYEIMSGRSEDLSDLIRGAAQNCAVEDLSAVTSMLAVQGPGSLCALAECMDVRAISKLTYFMFAEAKIRQVPCIVGRLGYTGEQVRWTYSASRPASCCSPMNFAWP